MSDSGLPTVDVVVAVRNEARRIGSCIESLLAQDYPAELVRIYVADNGSSDDTVSVASRYAVTVVHERKRGSAAARNRAIRESNADLIAFFDGHCVADKRWLSSMCTRFQDMRVGGAQARIEYAAPDPRVAEYLRRSGMDNYDRILEDTVYGTQNMYPWILSGNCMYRRVILERVGGFDEKLPACEDVDLAWKVVLSGYLLVNCPDASVVHFTDDDWKKFVGKSRQKGRGSAVLARRYLPHGARNAFEPTAVPHHGQDGALVASSYGDGYRYESERMSSVRSLAAKDTALPQVLGETRPVFSWTDNRQMSISTDAIYWFRGDSTSIVVNISTRSRTVLDESANFIWRQIARSGSREKTAQRLSDKYRISPEEAQADLDEFIDELLKAGLLAIANG